MLHVHIIEMFIFAGNLLIISPSLFRKDRPSDVVLSSAVVISHDMANLTWERHQGVTMIQRRDEGLPEIIPKSS